MRFVSSLVLALFAVSFPERGMAGGSAPAPSAPGAGVSGASQRPGTGAGFFSGASSGAPVSPSGLSANAPSAGGGAKSAGALSGGVVGMGLGVESPLVYRQAGYLGTIGPAPMRFGPPSPGCNERTPPRVSTNSKKVGPVATVQLTSPVPPPSSVNSPAAGAAGLPELFGGGAADPSGASVRDQAMSFFTAPAAVDAELQKNRLRTLLDPVPSFQPAPPPANPAQIPPSSATFRQN